MASIEAILPPALANAALLIAAPSLGCLTTYTRVLTDLCRSYDLPVSDLTHILQYRPSSLTTLNTERFQEVDQDTTDLQNDTYTREDLDLKLETIKEEPTDEYTDNNVTEPKMQEQYIKETMQDPNLTNASPLLFASKKASSKAGDQKKVNVANPNSSRKNYPKKSLKTSAHLRQSLQEDTMDLQNDNYAREDVELNLETIKQETTNEYTDINVPMPMTQEQYTKKTMQNPNLTSMSPLLFASKKASSKAGDSKEVNVANHNSPHKNYPKKSLKPSTHLRQSLAQSKETKTLLVVTIKTDGKLRMFSSREELYSWKTARDNMQVIHVNENGRPTDSVIYIITYREDPSHSFLKGRHFDIPISDILDIISQEDNRFEIHYSTNTDYKTLVLEAKATKASHGRRRSAIENKASIIRWLQNNHEDNSVIHALHSFQKM